MRQMIVYGVQLFAAEVSIDVRGGLVHREMRACVERFFFEHLRSQTKERSVPVSSGFNLHPADVAGAR